MALTAFFGCECDEGTELFEHLVPMCARLATCPSPCIRRFAAWFLPAVQWARIITSLDLLVEFDGLLQSQWAAAFYQLRSDNPAQAPAMRRPLNMAGPIQPSRGADLGFDLDASVDSEDVFMGEEKGVEGEVQPDDGQDNESGNEVAPPPDDACDMVDGCSEDMVFTTLLTLAGLAACGCVGGNPRSWLCVRGDLIGSMPLLQRRGECRGRHLDHELRAPCSLAPGHRRAPA